MAKTVKEVVIIGGGPAGLMAAEKLGEAGHAVTIYEQMPSVGRKFLIAGRGGLNLTHSEPIESFLSRYGDKRPFIEPLLSQFSPDDLQAWAHSLGVETFVGSSKRVFPVDMKAAPLLRNWLARLESFGVVIKTRHRWLGWDDEDGLLVEDLESADILTLTPDATILALGGGSWKKLGSDGHWVDILAKQGIEIAPLLPSNCGFAVEWSAFFREKFAGSAVKTAVLTHATFQRQGEFVITENGIEGSLVYAVSSLIRDEILQSGTATIYLDLLPDFTVEQIATKLAKPRGKKSLSSHIQSRLRLKGVKFGLLRDCLDKETFNQPAELAKAIKHLPIQLNGIRPIDEAISTAGGVSFAELDSSLQLKKMPMVYCVGEMLDWEAPTGGYLLTACFASGFVVAMGLGAGD